MLAAGTHDPVLAARLAGEQKQMQRIANGLSHQSFVVPWLAEPPVGLKALGALTACLDGAMTLIAAPALSTG